MPELNLVNSGDKVTVVEAINLALKQLMREDSSLVTFGLGVNDPKRIFGTTSGLVEEFGKSRVYDFPTSENLMTGYGLGLAINGIPSISVHQRFEFFLLAVDQLVNNVAKWHFMFGSQSSVPMVIRLIVGKGWGQGPTHSQSLHAWLSHIPGLKVAVPHDSQSAYDLLIDSVNDPNPVIFLEHRWIHEQSGSLVIRDKVSRESRLEARCSWLQNADPKVTIVSFSYLAPRVKMLLPSFAALNIGVEHIILETLKPYSLDAVVESVENSGRLLVLDFAARTNSFAKEIVAEVVMKVKTNLEKSPKVLTHPDSIEPTSHFATDGLYYDDLDIFRTVIELLGLNLESSDVQTQFDSIQNRLRLTPHDVPNPYFKGPF